MKKVNFTLFIALGLLVALSITTVKGQNMPLYTQYNLNPFVINPAAAGVEDGHRINLSFRSQWTGFPTAPSTRLLSYSGKFGQNGLGAMVFNDRSGGLEYNGALAAYNYHIKLSETSTLAVGLSMQLLRYQLQPDAVTLEGVDLTDEVVIDAINGTNTLEGTAGLFYYNDNGLYAGLSAPNMIQTKLGGSANTAADLNYLTTHYFAFAGYKMKVKNMTFDPSILARKVAGAPFQVELNGKLWFMEDQFLVGASYRSAENSVAFLAGFNLANTFRFVYSYDASFNELSNYHTGSNELTLGILLNKKKAE